MRARRREVKLSGEWAWWRGDGLGYGEMLQTALREAGPGQLGEGVGEEPLSWPELLRWRWMRASLRRRRREARRRGAEAARDEEPAAGALAEGLPLPRPPCCSPEGLQGIHTLLHQPS
ncbi:hypothetical protein NL676_004180 [Syzygium grande]|nr:hypothetical protein NL676_004180 [Syzygium grande]